MDQKPSRRRWLFGLLGSGLGGWLSGRTQPTALPPAPAPPPPCTSLSWADTSTVCHTFSLDTAGNRLLILPAGPLPPPDSGDAGPT